MSMPSTDELAKAIASAMRQASKKEPVKSAATMLVEMIEGSGSKVVMDQYRGAYLIPPPEWLISDINVSHSVGNVGSVVNSQVLKVGGSVINRSYESPTLPTLPTLTTQPGRALSFTGKTLEAILSRQFYKHYQRVPGSGAITSALTTIKGMHISTRSVAFWNRVGVDAKGDFWVDLSDGRYVWLFNGGWDIIEDAPILFQRHSYQLPLHTPLHEGEGDLFSILDYIYLPDCDSQLLYLICFLQCLIPNIPKAVLYITGEWGTVKSTGMGAIIDILDRCVPDGGLPLGMLTIHKDIKELVQNLDHHWICYFDNLSNLEEDQSDALSRAVTGAALEKRQLYSDDEDVARRFRRCVGFNSIGMVVTKSDLMSRSVVLETKKIPDLMRKTDSEILTQFRMVVGRIFGDALTVVAKAKKMIDEGFTISEKPRMADFAVWGEALSQAMGFAPEVFLNAYYQNMSTAMETVLRTNVVGGLLLDYLEDRLKSVTELEFSANQLYAQLRQLAENAHYNTKTEFPANPSKLGIAIKELASSLPDQGIRLTFKRVGSGQKYIFTRFVPTKLDEEYRSSTKRAVNSWAVSDIRKMRDQLKVAKVEEVEKVEKVEKVEPISKESVSLSFATASLLMQFKGEPIKDEDALAFLQRLGLPITRAVMVVASMMRDGAIFCPRPGYYQVSSSGERIA